MTFIDLSVHPVIFYHTALWKARKNILSNSVVWLGTCTVVSNEIAKSRGFSALLFRTENKQLFSQHHVIM